MYSTRIKKSASRPVTRRKLSKDGFIISKSTKDLNQLLKTGKTAQLKIQQSPMALSLKSPINSQFKTSRRLIHQKVRSYGQSPTWLKKSLPKLEQIPRKISQQRRRTLSNQIPLAGQNLRKVKNVVTKCAYRTKVGQIQQKPKPNNQDAFIIKPNMCNVKGQYLFSVCDGHGVNGHDVSAFVKRVLPHCVNQFYPKQSLLENNDQLVQILREGVLHTGRLLIETNIDISFSGTTLTSVLISGNFLVCANVGDSRAVLARKIGDNWHSIPLSRDHKPDEPDERQRILNANGRIEAYLDEDGNDFGPPRVWLSDQNVPGLAMSRSLGDVVASWVGVIYEPEMLQMHLTKDDKFIIIATDGIWEFISNEEAVQVISELWESNKTDGCCDNLVQEATIRWQQEDETIDDITIIVIFLKVEDQ